MSYNSVLMETINEGPHHMSPFMLLIHAITLQQIRLFNGLLAVELGTSHGNSMIAMAAAMTSEGKGLLHTCDLVLSMMAQNLIYRSGCADSVVFRKTDSVALASEFVDDTVGMLFIDTSHERKQTELELVAWAPKLLRSAIVLLHDTQTCPEGVDAPAREFADRQKWHYYNIAVDCGLGVLTKP